FDRALQGGHRRQGGTGRITKGRKSDIEIRALASCIRDKQIRNQNNQMAKQVHIWPVLPADALFSAFILNFSH
ncbi:MAG: hypothetical protein ACLFUY_06210, partial [Desulfobacterales bacterium]